MNSNPTRLNYYVPNILGWYKVCKRFSLQLSVNHFFLEVSLNNVFCPTFWKKLFNVVWLERCPEIFHKIPSDKVKCLVKLQSVISNYPKKRPPVFSWKFVNFFKTPTITTQILKFSFKHFFKDFYRDRLQILIEFMRINYVLFHLKSQGNHRSSDDFRRNRN